jgi:hypothetical protein
LTAKGKIPVEHDFETMGDDISDEMMDQARPFLMVIQPLNPLDEFL